MNQPLPTVELRAADKGIFVDGAMQLAALCGGTLVGCVDLYNYDPVNERAEVGIVVDAAYRRQGMASSMLAELDALCRHTLALHQLYCDVAVCNEAALKLFERAGYRRAALLHQWVKVGDRYADVVRLQHLLN